MNFQLMYTLYEGHLPLNNLQWWICHKTKPTQPNQTQQNQTLNQGQGVTKGNFKLSSDRLNSMFFFF